MNQQARGFRLSCSRKPTKPVTGSLWFHPGFPLQNVPLSNTPFEVTGATVIPAPLAFNIM